VSPALQGGLISTLLHPIWGIAHTHSAKTVRSAISTVKIFLFARKIKNPCLVLAIEGPVEYRA